MFLPSWGRTKHPLSMISGHSTMNSDGLPGTQMSFRCPERGGSRDRVWVDVNPPVNLWSVLWISPLLLFFNLSLSCQQICFFIGALNYQPRVIFLWCYWSPGQTWHWHDRSRSRGDRKRIKTWKGHLLNDEDKCLWSFYFVPHILVFFLLEKLSNFSPT